MGTVFGPFGFVYGTISFILSTAPAAVKFLITYEESTERLRGIQIRATKIHSQLLEWEIFWQKTDVGEHKKSIDAIREDIEKLKRQVNAEMKKYIVTESQRKAWRKMRRRLESNQFKPPRRQMIADQNEEIEMDHKKETEMSVGKRKLHQLYRFIFQLPPNVDDEFRRSVRYALLKENIIESWLVRMEKNFEAIEKLSESEIKRSTAGHFKSYKDAGSCDVTGLRTFITQLAELATTLHEECVKTISSTYGWGLGLRSPPEGKDISSWKFVPEVNFELRFSVKRNAYTENFQIKVQYHKEDQETHTSGNKIRDSVRRVVDGPGDNEHIHCPRESICTIQKPRVVRTRLLANLFENNAKLFNDGTSRKRWQFDRMRLILGVLNWTLLLWDSVWIKNICCHGLQLEKDEDALDYTMQIFTVENNHECKRNPLPLRNLGILLAEIFLTTSIKLKKDSEEREYERFLDGKWATILRKSIPDEVHTKTNSIQLRAAIYFCLTDPLANEKFDPGFLLKLIDSVYKPVYEWYKTEEESIKPYAELARNILEESKEQEWPWGAMYRANNSKEAKNQTDGSQEDGSNDNGTIVHPLENSQEVEDQNDKTREDGSDENGAVVHPLKNSKAAPPGSITERLSNFSKFWINVARVLFLGIVLSTLYILGTLSNKV